MVMVGVMSATGTRQEVDLDCHNNRAIDWQYRRKEAQGDCASSGRIVSRDNELDGQEL